MRRFGRSELIDCWSFLSLLWHSRIAFWRNHGCDNEVENGRRQWGLRDLGAVGGSGVGDGRWVSRLEPAENAGFHLVVGEAGLIVPLLVGASCGLCLLGRSSPH